MWRWCFPCLLRSVTPQLRYKGFDLSAAQIERARMNFGPYFEVRDIASISAEEMAGYDAIHCYSVFAFMPVADQLSTIRSIAESGAKSIFSMSVTMPDPDYAPRSCFRDFSAPRSDGRSLMTTISFPFRDELETALHGSKLVADFSETTYGSTRALNNSARAGGALAAKKDIKRRRKEYERIRPMPASWRLLAATISPKGWRKRHNNLSRDEVRTELLQRLQSTAN